MNASNTAVAVWGEPTLCHTIVPDGPLTPGTSLAGKISRHAGGSAFATAIGVAHLNTAVEFFGPFGTDAAGRWMLEQAAARGVRCAPVPAGASRQTMVFVAQDGERSMVTDFGDAFSAPYAELFAVDPAVHHVLHCSLSSVLRDQTGAVDRFLRRSAQKVAISLDLGSASALRAAGAARLRDLFETLSPTLLYANEDETQVLIDLLPDIRRVVPYLFEKHGAAPCSVWHAGAQHMVENPVTVAAVDTTGAGDAFAAGVLAAWSSGLTDPVALAVCGHRYASRAVAVLGTVVPVDQD